MQEENEIKRIGDIRPTFRQPSLFKKERSRKDDLWLFSYEKCKKTWPGKLTKAFFAIKTNHLKKEEDWAYLVSKCNQEEKRGEPWAKTFWGSIKSQ